MTHALTTPRLRARAIGIWTAAGGVAIAAGPVVGGFLLTGLGWRSIFLVNIPICALGLGLALRCVPPAQGGKKKYRSFDLAGQALAIVALAALIGAVIEARPLGLTHPIVSTVDRARSGTASAVLNSARQVGGAIGVAAFGALVSGVTAEQITSGLNIAALTAAALLIIATLIALSVHPK
jgi:MFS transporter, DHA2 family, methylenomycin A resistance protein